MAFPFNDIELEHFRNLRNVGHQRRSQRKAVNPGGCKAGDYRVC